MITEKILAKNKVSKLKRIQDLSDESRENETMLDVMIPYADLMTLLLVFFVFFYITVDYQKNLKIVEQNKKIVAQNEELKRLSLVDSLLDVNEEVIVIPGEVLFSSGQALLKWDALRTLKQVADNITAKIADEPGWQIRIEGHSDNSPLLSGDYGSNWDLSFERAQNVVRFLVDNNFFPPEQLQAMGYGEYKPLAPNDSPKNRKKNRRVEIRMIKTYLHPDNQ